MTMLHKVEFTCTNCTTPFEGYAVVSTTPMGGQTSDFRPVGAETLTVVIHTCPSCGYSGYEWQFDEPEPIPAEVARRIAEHLTPDAAAISRSSPRRYESAARIAEWGGASGLKIADLYLKAAWCCDVGQEVGEDDDEAYFRRKAIGYYERSLAAGEVGADALPGITYLVGELYRRIGEPVTAAVWFDRLIALAAGDPELADFAELATRQKTAPSDVM